MLLNGPLQQVHASSHSQIYTPRSPFLQKSAVALKVMKTADDETGTEIRTLRLLRASGSALSVPGGRVGQEAGLSKESRPRGIRQKPLEEPPKSAGAQPKSPRTGVGDPSATAESSSSEPHAEVGEPPPRNEARTLSRDAGRICPGRVKCSRHRPKFVRVRPANIGESWATPHRNHPSSVGCMPKLL